MTNYIPFEELKEKLIIELLREDIRFVVVQRFFWPSYPSQNTFIATPYQDAILANAHAGQLSSKEGRVIDLHLELNKVLNMVKGKEYFIFLNTFKEKNWASKTIKAYNTKIVAYVRSRYPTFRNSDGLDINIFFQYGRLMAKVSFAHVSFELLTYDLIK